MDRFLWLPDREHDMVNAKQIGILVVAILIGGGFAFGGIASYAGITGGGQQNSQGEFNAVVPEQNYQETPYNMSLREQQVLAYNEDIVFVNAFYENESQKEQLQQLQNLPNRFDNRVYVSVASSSSSSEILISYGLVDFPSAVVTGGSGVSQPDNVTAPQVSDAVCDVFRSLGDQSAQCL
ncbi:MAG: hypothetical protein ACI9LV_000356 [Candidatus Nanohaloarchaea archaeon]|jgi:hypothetical protein